MRSRGRIVFVATACISVVLVILIGFMVLREARALRKNSRELDSRRENLRTSMGLDPFPSPDNVKATSNNWNQLKRELTALSTRMGKGQIVPDADRTPLQWITLLSRTQKDLRKRAETNEVRLAEDFSFGFELYDEGTPPSGANVPRLTQQLLMVNELCRTLYDAGIKELSTLERTEFESEVAGRVTRIRRRGGIESTKTNVFDAICPKERFVMEYVTGEDALIASLDGLASHRMFIVVSDIELRGDPGIRDDSAEKAKILRPSEEEEEENEEEEETAPMLRDPRKIGERFVSGPELEVPASVKITLDVYTFMLAKGMRPR